MQVRGATVKIRSGQRKWTAAGGAFLAIGLAAHGARAQLAVAPGVSEKAGDTRITSRIGISLQAGGGVSNFSGSTARDVTDVGGYWDVRAVFGTRSFVA